MDGGRGPPEEGGLPEQGGPPERPAEEQSGGSDLESEAADPDSGAQPEGTKSHSLPNLVTSPRHSIAAASPVTGRQPTFGGEDSQGRRTAQSMTDPSRSEGVRRRRGSEGMPPRFASMQLRERSSALEAITIGHRKLFQPLGGPGRLMVSRTTSPEQPGSGSGSPDRSPDRSPDNLLAQGRQSSEKINRIIEASGMEVRATKTSPEALQTPTLGVAQLQPQALEVAQASTYSSPCRRRKSLEDHVSTISQSLSVANSGQISPIKSQKSRQSLEGGDRLPERPSSQRLSLDRILNHELSIRSSALTHGTSNRSMQQSIRSSNGLSSMKWTPKGMVELEEVLNSKTNNFWSVLFANRWFTGVFMVLTFYALYIPDLDQMWGDITSEAAVQVVTTIVCFLFLVELIVHHLGDDHYIYRAFFWLDLIALVSLIPETVLARLFTDSGFEESPGEMARLIRMASRSSKATRLNRLTRVVRVVALMPRLQRFIGRKTKESDIQRMIDQKLTRIFYFLDEDLDNQIIAGLSDRCIARIDGMLDHGRRSRWGVAAFSSRLTRSLSFNRLSPKPVVVPAEDGDTDAEGVERPPDDDFLPQGVSARSLADPQKLPDSDGRAETQGSSELRTTFAQKGTANSSADLAGSTRDDDELYFYESDVDLICFDEFKRRVLDSAPRRETMRAMCKQALEEGNNMQSVNTRFSEHIAIKVALMILFLLFVLTMVDVVSTNTSTQWGLGAMDKLVRAQYPNEAPSETIPLLVREQVNSWVHHRSELQVDSLRLLYLDLDSRVYCNELLALPAECSTSPTADLRWGARGSIASLRTLMGDSDYRRRDLQLVLSPDLADEALSEEELEQQTDAAAVLNVRAEVEHSATISILQTTLVMLTIMISVYLYTKDLTFLSSNLLKPLVDLSDEMESITRLQMAGVAASRDADEEAEESHHVRGTSEIRLIKSSFENMKKAIRSWGKYVPWPVVQLLLRKDTEDTLEVSEKEVSIFFSDIAGFTGIVEGLPPEKSLLLLSRYFHDMSKVIDSYEGIVLEFIGDAIMSVYGAPIPNVDHPTAAVKSALKMLSCLRVMNRWFSERGLPNINIRCGVHTGCVLVGNMGFEKRLKYGVVGDESNVPSCLEELNKSYGTEMLISQATFDRLAKGSFVTRPIDVIYIMSGESQLVYQVFTRDTRQRTSALREACDLHAEAIEQYLQRNFSEARAKFAEVLKRMRDLEMDERASEVFMGRCDEYLGRPPPEDWDGVWEGN